MRISTRTAIAVAAVAAAAATLGVGDARSEVASPWKIDSKRDRLTDEVTRFAVTAPKSNPLQHGRPVTTGLLIRCVRVFMNKPTEPELSVIFAKLTALGHLRHLHTRYRFDEGPVRDYSLEVAGGGPQAISLPKFSDQDPIADIVAAKRLRVEVEFPREGATLLDFNVSGAGDAVRAISCQ